MNKILIRPGLTSLVCVCALLLTAATAFGQVGLRNALDYDGDKKADIAVVRDGAVSGDTLTWYVRKSSDGNLLAYNWGITGPDLTVQNDYDGDGKTDVAIWRKTNGTFYIRKSSDGGAITAQWGLDGDYPIAVYDTH